MAAYAKPNRQITPDDRNRLAGTELFLKLICNKIEFSGRNYTGSLKQEVQQWCHANCTGIFCLLPSGAEHFYIEFEIDTDAVACRLRWDGAQTDEAPF